MKNEQFEPYKLVLEKDWGEIIAELQTIARQDPVTGDWVAVPETEGAGEPDENTEADVVEEWEGRDALVAQLEIRYRNIQRALNKIEEGTYGICEISGEQIEPERLAVNPSARTNIANRDRERELSL